MVLNTITAKAADGKITLNAADFKADGYIFTVVDVQSDDAAVEGTGPWSVAATKEAITVKAVVNDYETGDLDGDGDDIPDVDTENPDIGDIVIKPRPTPKAAQTLAVGTIYDLSFTVSADKVLVEASFARAEYVDGPVVTEVANGTRYTYGVKQTAEGTIIIKAVTRAVDISAIKAEAIAAIIAAAEEALKNGALENAQRNEIISIRDNAVKNIESAAVTTVSQVNAIRDNAIAAIQAVKAPGTLDPDIFEPSIDVLNGTIDLKYYLEGSATLTREKLVELLNNNELGKTFTVNEYIPEVLDQTDGKVTPAKAVVTDGNSLYSVTLLRVYKVTLDGELGGYVSAAMKAPLASFTGKILTGIAPNTYYLKAENAAGVPAADASVKADAQSDARGEFTVGDPGGVIAQSVKTAWDGTTNYTYGDVEFVSAYKVKGDGTNTYSVKVTPKGTAAPVTVALDNTNVSVFIQTGAMLEVTGTHVAAPTAPYNWVMLMVDDEQNLDSVKYVTAANSAVKPVTVTENLSDNMDLAMDSCVQIILGSENLGYFNSTDAAAPIETKQTGTFVPYVYDPVTPKLIAYAADSKETVAEYGSVTLVAADLTGNTLGGILTLVPAVEVTVPSGGTGADFEDVTAMFSFGDLEDVALSATVMGNAAAEGTFFIAQGAVITFGACEFDAISVDYTAPGAKKPVPSVTPVTDEKTVELVVDEAGSYEVGKLDAVSAIVLALDTAAANASKWGTLAVAVKSVDGTTGQSGITTLTLDEVVRRYVGKDGITYETETGTGATEAAKVLGNAAEDNGLTITLTLEADDGFFFVEDLEVTNDNIKNITVEVAEDGSTVTIIVTYQVTA